MLNVEEAVEIPSETSYTFSQMVGRHEALMLAADLLTKHPSRLLQAPAIAEELRAEAQTWLDRAQPYEDALSPGQRKVYDNIKAYTETHGRSPSMHQLVKLEIGNPAAVRLHVFSMASRGIVYYAPREGITVIKEV